MGRPPTIGIDASRLSVARLTGTETYSRQLLLAMTELERPEPFELYLNASCPPPGMPELGTPVCMPFPRFWTHLRLSWQMASRPPGVLFVPAHVIPLVHPRSVVTIHDLGYLEHPETHTPTQLRALEWTTRWSGRVAQHVIAISNATRRDLIERYGVAGEKISVIPHGVHTDFAPAPPQAVADLRARLALPERYVLAVGTIQPRKNLARLAEAVSRLRGAGEQVALVIAGKRGWLAADVEREIAARTSTGSVHFTGYVEDHDLPLLYSGASVFALPSLYEGFGMPLLEAMACGVPVLAGDNSAMPEVGGDAALYARATDVHEIAAGLHRLLSDSSLAAELTSRGRARASQFTWRATAEATLELLRRVRDA